MALGHGSSTTGLQTCALPIDSVAGRADVVAFGHAAGDLGASGTAYGSDLNRRLIHVADGIDTTDAVNKGQLDAAIAGVTAGGSGTPNAVAYDGTTQSDLTLAGTGGTAIHNVADGTADSDAVNKGQLDAGDAATLASAEGYADSGDRSEEHTSELQSLMRNSYAAV